MCNQKEMFLMCLVFSTLANTLTDSRSLHKHGYKSKKYATIFRPEEMGPGDDIVYPTRNSRVRRQVSPYNYQVQKWEGNTIPFVIANTFSQREVNMIINAMKTIQNVTCLKFTPRRNDRDYVYFTNENGAAAGCRSPVGRDGGGQVIDLASPYCTSNLDTIMHEILHSVGFWHEISRPDRDKYVIINFYNIEENQRHNFEKRDMDTSLAYDYLSIMHYSADAFAIDRRYPTIVPRIPGAPLGLHNGLSQLDIAKINLMYNCYNSRDRYFK